MEKKISQKKNTVRKKSSTTKRPSIDELNAYAKEYFKTHELHPSLKGVAGIISTNKTLKQLMSE